MIIQNQANPNKTKYISNKPTKEEQERYYNDFQLSELIAEMMEVKGVDATIQYLQNKIKTLKAIKKEGK